MRFSVITITLNAEKFLNQALSSVAAQKGVSWEHLLWDGGSSDRTLSIARSFPSLRVIQGKDKGIADAMNQAAEHVLGDYLLFLHADDLLIHPHVLLMFDRILRQHPQVEWIYGRARIINEEGSIIRTTPYEPFSSKRLLKYNFITHPACILSRSLFHRIGGYRNDLKYSMDYDLWLRASLETTPFALSSIMASFRQHSYSLSTSEPLQVADEAYSVRNSYLSSFYQRFCSYRTWKKRKKEILIIPKQHESSIT